MQLALVDSCLLVAMQKFDGIFDGQDVIRLLLVHLVQNRGKTRGLSGAGWAGDQYNAISQLHDLLQRCGKAELLEAGDTVGNHAHYNCAGSALAKNIYAKSPDAINPV